MSNESERNSSYNDRYNENKEKNHKEVERNGTRSRSQSIEGNQKPSHEHRSSSSEPSIKSEEANTLAFSVESDKEIQEGVTVCREDDLAPTPTKVIYPTDTEEESPSVNSPLKQQSRLTSPIES